MTSSRSLVAAIAALLCWPAGGACAAEPADLVLRAARVYTVDAQRSWASAVAIEDGRVRYVGDDAAVASLIGPETRVLDLAGRMVLPGFHDSHVHLMVGGTWTQRCQLAGLAWPEEVIAALGSCIAHLAAGEWLYAMDLAPAAFAGRGPTRELLDAIAAERPAVVRDRSGKMMWANSRVLTLAGITAGTPDSGYGTIERDPATGEPSGTLRGDAAARVYPLIPEPDVAHYLDGLRRASTEAHRLGITAIIEASVSPRMLETYVEAERIGVLELRVLTTQRVDASGEAAQLDALIARANDVTSPHLSARGAKLFLDGGSVQGTAALFEPYAGNPTNRGQLNWRSADLESVVSRLDAAGLQVHLHAVGDRAIRQGLDALAAAAERNGPRDRRHQMAHLVLPDPADIARLARLGVTADIQAIWAQPDADTRGAIPLLGPERAGQLLPFASLFAAGVRVVGGSDWPSISLSPLDAIQVGVTRQSIDGSAPAWIPEQRVALADMLAAYTINGAWLAGQDQLTGSIETGKAADLVVLDRDLFAVAPLELHEVRVLLTLLDGKVVYCAEDFPCP